MRKKIGDPYETVGLCGSFRRHMGIINDAHSLLVKNGFTVLAPSVVSSAVNPGDEFVLLESDTSDDPRRLEGQYQDRLSESDVVYVCNPGGYTGGSVMMELGKLAGVAEVYFMEEPQEPVIRAMAQGAILSMDELIKRMQSHNEVMGWREWPDTDRGLHSNFTFND